MSMATNNFAFIPLEVIQDIRLTKRHIKVLIALFSYRGKNTNTVWPSREKLSKRCSIRVSTISLITTQLVELGWLVKTGRGGFSKATRYEITVPDLSTVHDLGTGGVHDLSTGMGVPKVSRGKELTNNKPIELKGGNKRFKPPTVDEVRAYCIDRGNSIDADAFVDHYQTNGWMRGKNKIKDWKACVRTWEVAQKNRHKSSHVKAAISAMQGLDIDTGRAFDGLEQIEGLLN
jgi:hypothetical protein